MKDRFRFRAWHKPTKKLFEVYSFNDELVFENTLDGVGSPTNPADIADCVLEQCTGLKDKNGRLVYEGDIIASRFQGQLFTANIKYLRAGWVAEFHYWKPSLYQMCNEAKFEVIGNIHENPELLEDK